MTNQGSPSISMTRMLLQLKSKICSSWFAIGGILSFPVVGSFEGICRRQPVSRCHPTGYPHTGESKSACANNKALTCATPKHSGFERLEIPARQVGEHITAFLDWERGSGCAGSAKLGCSMGTQRRCCCVCYSLPFRRDYRKNCAMD